jgi:hypothetical protein
VPMRWASEAIITDFYCDNPYYRELYKNRQLLYNAVYYHDYFLPEIEKINANDSVMAKRIFDNETGKSGFAVSGVGKEYDYEDLKIFYANEIERCLKNEDSVFFAMKDLAESKFIYSNLAVDKVINNQNSTEPMLISGDYFVRKYKPVYSLPFSESNCRRFFLCSYVTIKSFSIRTLHYNLLVIMFYDFFLIVFILISDIRVKSIFNNE